jgi:hypothetical protein
MLGTRGTSGAVSADVAEATRAAVGLVRAGALEPSELAERLYATWYAAETATGERDEPPPGFPTDLVGVLRAAHAGTCRWESGWMVERVGPAAKVAVERAGERRVLYRADYVPARPGLAAAPGELVTARARRDLVDPDGGWWRTRGPSWIDSRPPTDLVRLYWTVRLGELPHLVELLTAVLEELDGPWMVKCAVDAVLHGRPDAVVAYLRTADLWASMRRIEDIRLAVEHASRPGRPPFTLPVGPGLAIADDPGGSRSFGEHRCGLVAAGVCAAGPDARVVPADAAIGSVAERFRAAGIDPARPWAAGPSHLPWEAS